MQAEVAKLGPFKEVAMLEVRNEGTPADAAPDETIIVGGWFYRNPDGSVVEITDAEWVNRLEEMYGKDSISIPE